jgi:prolyl-tRNA editing enzyme YbaK/EbsC (Cys-tRNA(Pro) deacylase)
MNERPKPEEVAIMYRHAPATEVSKIAKVPLCYVYKSVRMAGDEVGPRGRRPVLINPGKEALDTLKAAGYSQRQIAEMHDVSKRTVQRWIESCNSVNT